jgi:hypothetical protein
VVFLKKGSVGERGGGVGGGGGGGGGGSSSFTANSLSKYANTISVEG